MKSIAGFICFVSLFCSAVFVESAHGEIRLFGKPYDFSLAPQAGLVYGTVYEIVYWNEGSDDYLSELQWELNPLFVMGLDISLEPVRTWGFFTKLNIKAGLPFVSGTMEDRDWQDREDRERLTDFSSHTNKTREAVLLTLDAGFSFPVREWFFLRPFVSFDYFYFRMEGQDGYGFYGKEPYKSNNWKFAAFSGPVIRYTQHWLLFSPGLFLGFTLNRFTILGGIKITPFIFCTGIDDHLTTEASYTDYMRGKIAVEPSLDISFAVSSRLAVGFACSYRYIAGTRGDTLIDESFWSLNLSGAGLRLFESALYLKFGLGKQ